MHFKDRQEAGLLLAQKLREFTKKHSIVAGLPNGGIVLADCIARELNVPLDMVIVRKLGVPHQEEIAFGALAEDAVKLIDEASVALASLDEATVDRVVDEQTDYLKERILRYRSVLPKYEKARVDHVILVDDGLATGLSMQAAIEAARKMFHPSAITVAIPVASLEALVMIKKAGAKTRALYTPVFFESVGSFYDNFSQVTDEEVFEILKPWKREEEIY